MALADPFTQLTVPPSAPPLQFDSGAGAAPLLSDARRLLSGDDVIMRQLADAAGGFAVNLAAAIAILAATIWAAGLFSRLTARAIARAHRGPIPDTTLQSFAASLARYSVMIVGLVGVLDQLGVRATSVIAVLGAASLAIGLALQGALANVAAGVMILILRPYRVGDDVVINGKEGVVKGLDLFSTRLNDPDNLEIFVPNSKAFGEIIVNTTSTPARRVQIAVTIDRTDDPAAARRLMLEVAKADRRVLAAPAQPWAHLTAIKDSGFEVTLRCFVAPGVYGDALSDLMLAAIERLRAEGLTLPYPHQVSVESRPFKPPKALRETAGEAASEPRSFAPNSSPPAKPRGRGRERAAAAEPEGRNGEARTHG